MAYVEASIKEAEAFRAYVRQMAATTYKYEELTDEQKIDMVMTNEQYRRFYMQFPVVARFIVCVNQYSAKAFRRYVASKCAPYAKPKEGEPSREIHLQARYVQNLWESLHPHAPKSASNAMYNQSLRSLEAEEKAFKERYSKIEADYSSKHEANQIEKLKELVNELAKNNDVESLLKLKVILDAQPDKTD